MHTQTFLDILDLAWEDLRHQDPKALGIAVVLFRKDSEGALGIQLGANVDIDIVEFALASMVRAWMRGEDRPTMHRRKKTRKIV